MKSEVNVLIHLHHNTHRMIFVHVLAVVLVLLKSVQDLGIKHFELRTCPLSKILDSKKACTREPAHPSSSEKRNFTDTYIMIPATNTCYEWKYWKSFGQQPISYSCSFMYGPRHAYITILESNMCYEWGKWEYPRTIQCSDDGIKCCFQNSRVESKGTTLCDHKIEEFHKVWDEHGKYYNICYRNCQTKLSSMESWSALQMTLSSFGQWCSLADLWILDRYAISLQTFLEECPRNPASSVEVCQMQNASLESFHIRRLDKTGREIEIRHVDSTELGQYFEEVNIDNRETIEICQTHMTTASDPNERVCLVLS